MQNVFIKRPNLLWKPKIIMEGCKKKMLQNLIGWAYLVCTEQHT